MSMDTTRLAELVERLVGPGPKAVHVSASECHEIHDDVMALIRERRQLATAVTTLLGWIRPLVDSDDPRLLAQGGHETQLLPMFTRVGTETRDEAIAKIQKLIAPDPT